mgnify:CR=1 FL=1
MERIDGRRPEEMRPLRFTTGFIPHAEGSALIELGRTRVICTVTIEEGVPPFFKGSGRGWLTAEYSMLPRATPERSKREAVAGRQTGRTMEIQRFIGRSLRAVTDLNAFGERTFRLDCDVIEADGGTRTAALNGAYVALREAFRAMVEAGELPASPHRGSLAAISAGIIDGVPCIDLCFEEDFRAEVDMNLVADGSGSIVEIQATGESGPLSRENLDTLLDMGLRGTDEIIRCQEAVLAALD